MCCFVDGEGHHTLVIALSMLTVQAMASCRSHTRDVPLEGFEFLDLHLISKKFKVHTGCEIYLPFKDVSGVFGGPVGLEERAWSFVGRGQEGDVDIARIRILKSHLDGYDA
jgi:hypothetical protein